MKFLLDENIDRRIINFLTSLNHSATHIQDIKIGLSDIDILDLSVLKRSVVITFDKDFGELIFKDGKSHKGVILLRLEDQTAENTIKVLKIVLKRKQLEDEFIVVSEKVGEIKVRVKK
jgi:predicted nuclease of predicted toxin-antitoxin system